jgi:hypothetical protein
MAMINRARLTAKKGQREGSGLPCTVEARKFDFDELAREVARGLSRREALKFALTGLAGAALTSLGIKTAWATTCDCNGEQNYPILDLAACPNRLQVKAPSTDGICTSSPWQGFEGVDFRPCCVQHDYCFTTCGSSFETCNFNLFACIVGACKAGLTGTERLECEGIAFLMYEAVSTHYPDPPPNSPLPASGYSDFVDDQSTYCACCSCLDGQTLASDNQTCLPYCGDSQLPCTCNG